MARPLSEPQRGLLALLSDRPLQLDQIPRRLQRTLDVLLGRELVQEWEWRGGPQYEVTPAGQAARDARA